MGVGGGWRGRGKVGMIDKDVRRIRRDQKQSEGFCGMRKGYLTCHQEMGWHSNAVPDLLCDLEVQFPSL